MRRVQENDDTLESLWIGIDYNGDSNGGFNSSSGSDFSTLGTCIGENTHLTKLSVWMTDVVALDVTNSAFYDGLIRNSSIHKLTLYCGGYNIIEGGVAHEILKAYQENNDLTYLCINNAVSLQNGGENVIATTLRNSTNLKHMDLYGCNPTNEQLPTIVEAVRGHRSLEKLFLHDNRIDNAGCETLATLLQDPCCNLQIINLMINNIGSNGAVTLANGLANNTKLKHLFLDSNPIGQEEMNVFSRLLCNTTSISNTFSSNHTLEKLGLPQPWGEQLASLLKLNKGTNKSHVAIKKILKYHPIIDMSPLFEWNMEGEGERDLKALPYAVSWFDRAREVDYEGEYDLNERQLSAIYQFAQAMPLMFVPASRIKGENNKRKRGSV